MNANAPRVHQATVPCLDSIIEIRRSSGHSLPPAPHLITRLRGLVDRMTKDLEQTLGRQEADDVRYAIIALADEVGQAHDSLGDAWVQNSLQAYYYDESNAGEGFFLRLDDLLRRQASAEIIRVYYECLLLGFQGQYALRRTEHERLAVLDRVREVLLRVGLKAPAMLSPSGDRPTEPKPLERRRMLLLAFPVAMAILALVVYLAMRVFVDSKIQQTIDVLHQVMEGER
jgi:type VI secretion system protein ImpK